jgi:hypothetical protein
MADSIVLALFVLLPALVFAQLPARARRYFLAAAVAALSACELLIRPSLPALSPLLSLALLGIILGALLVEAVAFARGMLARKGGAAHG